VRNEPQMSPRKAFVVSDGKSQAEASSWSAVFARGMLGVNTFIRAGDFGERQSRSPPRAERSRARRRLPLRAQVDMVEALLIAVEAATG